MAKRAGPDDDRRRTLPSEVAQAMRAHPLLRHLPGGVQWTELPHEVSVRVAHGRLIEANLARRWSVPEWVWLITHARLHLALGHPFDVRRSTESPMAFAVARCLVVNDLLFQLGVGTPPAVDGRALVRTTLPERDVDRLVMHLQRQGIRDDWRDCGGVHGGPDVVGEPPTPPAHGHYDPYDYPSRESCAAAFAHAIRASLQDGIDLAGGVGAFDDHGHVVRSDAALAARWIRSSLPVIGALLDRYRIVDDLDACRRAGITVAAICDATQEILLNRANLAGEEEYRFVIAHELLHAGLRHGDRCGGRDPLWWNAACDFVINGWLLEMGVGRPPSLGGLHDPALKGLSAEAVYDRIQATMDESDLEGFAERGDIRADLGGRRGDWTDLDTWCRNALLQGLELHQARRGSLPAGLVEEIRSLAQPPIVWDVELARWFEREIGVVPRRRTYARASRRQTASPDIPRPRLVPEEEETGTFGAVVDTSGSMDRALLGKALGAVAGYAIAREVRRLRLVFCDAAAHDAGWVEPERLLDRVEVLGRGGTRLQPGIDLLEEADDFPAAGPVLIVTDGQCDRFQCRRTHAILTPAGARLPFTPRGEVFRLS